MSSSLDQKTGVNALLCYIVLGYAEKIKQCFIKIMSLPSNQVGKEEGNFTSERNNFKGVVDVVNYLRMIYYVVVRLMNRWLSQNLC